LNNGVAIAMWSRMAMCESRMAMGHRMAMWSRMAMLRQMGAEMQQQENKFRYNLLFTL
jgi:hypothetical protein